MLLVMSLDGCSLINSVSRWQHFLFLFVLPFGLGFYPSPRRLLFFCVDFPCASRFAFPKYIDGTCVACGGCCLCSFRFFVTLVTII